MNRISLIIVPIQILLGIFVLGMAVMIEMPLIAILGIALIAASSVSANISSVKWPQLSKLALLAASIGSILALAGFVLTLKIKVVDNYYALIAWLLASIIFGAQIRMSDSRANWRLLVLLWGFLGGFTWLTASYLQNLPGGFCIGLLGNTAFLILSRRWFRLGAIGIQIVNTLILLFITLPAADFFMRLHSRSEIQSDPESYYSYEAAKKHPAGYALWTRAEDDQWVSLAKQVFVPAPERDPPVRLRPGSHGYFFRCPISINRLGFRGREIPDAKGDTYRIVAIGESTTFGATLKSEDRPWPELLEQIIRERLKTRRPVEVINAGVPSYNLETNLRRLTSEILPLKPDMIISYHGYNGFKFIDGALPPPHGKAPPLYHERPLKLLADLEYGIKLTRYKKRMTPPPGPVLKTPSPMETRYAADYRGLVQIARTNHIRLVVANYSMAASTNSDPALIEFFRGAYPQVQAQIRANAIHSDIVRQLADENPVICFVDTHPNLDDHHDKFIDLVHFTQGGRQQLAETMFAGIRKILEQDLSAGD